MSAFFRYRENANIVEQGMAQLYEAMKKYDADRSMRLSKSESDLLFRDIFPSYIAIYEQSIADISTQVIYPEYMKPRG